MDPSSWLLLCRTVRFGETDAAGVMHFHQLLRWCHEAYEESLERFGIPPGQIFPGPSLPPGVPALPIVHCSADFLRPLRVGDPLAIALRPERVDPGCFDVHYGFTSAGEAVARGRTRHRAIHPEGRARCPLPDSITRWLEASGLAEGVRPL
ncbi:MAG: thioesterase family protein [Cyanobacteriota bacterium]|jgi:1,4-dihydroxy-2-naphthoyl-CoA hydrolase|nr:thioesterase family protein [Cyanobacteriota bacterium]